MSFCRGGEAMGAATALGYLAAGMLPLLWLTTLPTRGASLLLLIFGLAAACWHHPWLLRLGLLSLGLLWGSERAQLALQPLTYADRQVTLEGRIETPYLGEETSRHALYLWVTRLDARTIAPFRLRLYWNATRFPYAAGQRWRITLTPRALHGSLNPAGFDRQRHQLAQGVVLSGTPRRYQRLDAQRSLRQRAIDQACARWGTHPAFPLLLALVYGERGRLTSEQQALLRHSGILHLLAISGLHIALAAGFAAALWRLLCLGLPLRWQTPYPPLLLALSAAWGYAWLAGLSPPTLRAALMVTLYLVWRWGGRQAAPRDILTLTLSLTLLLDPLLLLSSALWLSLGAVAALLLWHDGWPFRPRWRWAGCNALRRLLHLQWGLLLLLTPLQLLLFHGLSWSAPGVNLLAVPLVSLAVMPLALAGLLLTLVISPTLGALAWQAALWLLDGLLALLTRLPDGWLYLSEPTLLAACWVPLMVLLWSWRQDGWDAGHALLASLLALTGPLAECAEAEATGWRVEMMDVGHGLAVLIQRHGHALLYDTGGRWPGGDAARQTLLPYLRWRGLILDGMIISHADSDHAGGRASLQRAYPLAWVASPDPADRPCRQGLHAYWRGLRLAFLWPPRPVATPRNNDSCVLRLQGPGGALLLTGDIEAISEQALVASGASLRAALLQVPHHGSATSSSPALLQAVRPAVALASAARYSAWRFPAPAVRQRYRQQGIAWHDSAHDGMIRVDFSSAGWQIRAQRSQIDAHWYHAWFGVTEHNG
ncbi:DNA internalization-related competence protein ComEC/Rec2 [Edwardsiella tarda]|uniref:DNA internalization-related competence protein ComEC/Rec2 n=2 Tax=Edwardsiella tarda TaxID=636 RepID=UPI0037BE64FE